MNDLVSKTEVIKRIKEQYSKHNELIPFWLSIGDMPAVEERPTAKWIKQGHGIGYRCSNCGKIVLADDSNELNYCCNCGAKMRGGTK